MFYNVAGKNLDLGGEITTEDILKDIIQADQASQLKLEMVKGVKYYNTQNDIINRDFREFWVDGNKYIDYNKSNDMIINNMQKKLVDQKVGYIAGKPIIIKSENEDLAEAVTDLLGEKWHDTLQEWVQGASNKGREELQPFIDEDGNFDYTLIPAEQVVYITDTTYQQKVVQAVRYYVMDWVKDGETKQSIRIELWDEEKVTKFQEIEDDFGNRSYQFIQPGTLGVTVNPQYHWYDYNTNFVDKSQLNSFNDADLTGVEGNGWGRVPFVSLKNNSEIRSDLMPIKLYIDAMDIVSSGFINDLKDMQLAVWVLRGYEGTKLDEFMLNLQKFKAISLSTDDNSSAEPKTMKIPKEARAEMLSWLEKKIYEVGQGVDEKALAGGSITNVVIKAMYAGLDLKADQLITKMKSAISDFMYFAVKFINDRDNTDYNYKDLKFTFDKSMIFNSKEIVETLIMLIGVMSNRTILANLPYVDDVEKELELIAQEKEEAMQSMGGGMDFDDDEVN